ncbi:hypothetical protein F5Y10DRAFT_57909 [Nemania abortiva]|nr:hypothetical protein F5Y10DRAFT_57909 [Nemania abortiva]
MAFAPNGQDIYEWLGLVVDMVNENDLPQAAQGAIQWRDLPVQPVRFPVDDPRDVAICSWRWDIEEPARPSQNIPSMIRHAKEMGIRYLLIDIISIDQQLQGHEMIKRVAAFSTLYRSIPVIVAYDKFGEEFNRTMRRPWIMKEMLEYQNNPTRVVYVSHNGQGINDFGFKHMLARTRDGNFAATTISILCGNIGMQSIRDFKYIIPKYADIITIAYEQMCRNDYLLTVAILCLGKKKKHVNEYNNLTSLTFNQYRLVQDTRVNSSWWQYFDIVLNGNKIATWSRKNEDYSLDWNNPEKCYLSALPQAGRVICTALHINDSTRHLCDAQEEAPSLSKERDDSSPDIEVVEVDIGPPWRDPDDQNYAT